MAYVQYSITELCKQQPLERLLYVSSTSYGKDWISMFHSHSFSEMFYVIEGEGQFCTENASVPIKKNNLIIINPNIMHTEKSLPGNPLTYIVLGIDNLQFQFRDQSHEYYNVYDFSHSRSEIIPLLRMMLEELKQKKLRMNRFASSTSRYCCLKYCASPRQLLPVYRTGYPRRM